MIQDTPDHTEPETGLPKPGAATAPDREQAEGKPEVQVYLEGAETFRPSGEEQLVQSPPEVGEGRPASNPSPPPPKGRFSQHAPATLSLRWRQGKGPTLSVLRSCTCDLEQVTWTP